MRKRILCLVISLLMILTAIPFSASAENAEDSLSEVGCTEEWFTIRNMLEESYPLVDDTSFTYESRMALKEVLDYVTSVYIINDGGCIEMIEDAVNALVPVDNTNTRYELRASYNSWNTTSISANITADTITHEEILNIPAGTHGFKILNTASNVWYGSEDIIYDRCEDYSLTTTTADASIMATGGTYQLTINYESEDTLSITITPLELITTAPTDPVETTTPPVITEPTDPVEVTDPTESNEPFTTFSDDYYDDDHDYELDCNCWMYLLLDSTIYEAEELLASDTLYTPESRANLERVLAIAKEQQGMFVADDPLGLVADLDKAISAMVIMSTETTPDEQIFLYGDVDMDFRITVRDATTLQKHLAILITLSREAAAIANVDRNDALNIKDATHIQKYIALIPTNYYTGTPFDYSDLTEPVTEPDWYDLLQKEIQRADSVLNSIASYTPDSYEAFLTAYNEAKGVVPSDKSLKECYYALSDAIDNLIPFEEEYEIDYTPVDKKSIYNFTITDNESNLYLVNSRDEALRILDYVIEYTPEDSTLAEVGMSPTVIMPEFEVPVLDEKYDDAYFRTNALLISFAHLGALGNSRRVDKITIRNNTLTMYATILENADIYNYAEYDNSCEYFLMEVSRADTTRVTDCEYIQKIIDDDDTVKTRVHFIPNYMWEHPYISAVYSDGDNMESTTQWGGEFPGTKMIFKGFNEEGKPIYYYDIPTNPKSITFADESLLHSGTAVIEYPDHIHETIFRATYQNGDGWNISAKLNCNCWEITYLNELISAAESLLESETEYTAQSRERLINALEQAKLIQDSYNIGVIVDASDELLWAIEALTVYDDTRDIPFALKETGVVSGLNDNFACVVGSRQEAEEIFNNTVVGKAPVLSDEYDDAYFEEHSLIIVFTTYPNLGIAQRLDRISYEEGSLILQINLYHHQGPSPSAMKYEYMLIEVDSYYKYANQTWISIEDLTYRTVYFAPDETWEDIYVYGFWGNYEDDTYTEWPDTFPGVKIQKTSTTFEGKTVYRCKVPADIDYIRFSEGASGLYHCTYTIKNSDFPNNTLIYTIDSSEIGGKWEYMSIPYAEIQE